MRRALGAGTVVLSIEVLSYGVDSEEARSQLARDFSCIAALGTGGCDFEQTLESGFKALWPKLQLDAAGNVKTPNDFRFLSITEEGTWGRGDLPVAQGGNLGFLRNDASPSLIAIVALTDEDDCSMRQLDPYKPNNQLAENDPLRLQDINPRCFYNKDKLFDVEQRYLKGLQALRPNDPKRVVFAAITGVPTDLVDAPARGGRLRADGGTRSTLRPHPERHAHAGDAGPRNEPGHGPG